MAKKISVADEVLAFIPKSNRHLSWWDRYAETHADVLDGLLAARTEGGLRDLPMRVAAKTISSYLATKGIKIGFQGVENWLRAKAQ